MESLLVRMSVRRSDTGPLEGYVVAFDDVTDLVSAQRMAAWGDVARRIAHEIKNPLTPIQLSAERIKRKFRPWSAIRPLIWISMRMLSFAKPMTCGALLMSFLNSPACPNRFGARRIWSKSCGCCGVARGGPADGAVCEGHCGGSGFDGSGCDDDLAGLDKPD